MKLNSGLGILFKCGLFNIEIPLTNKKENVILKG